jgi:hypothetical protein
MPICRSTISIVDRADKCIVATLAGRPQDDFGWRSMMTDATKVMEDVSRKLKGDNVRGNFYQLRGGYSYGGGQEVCSNSDCNGPSGNSDPCGDLRHPS